MRFVDIMLSIPSLLMAISISVLLGAEPVRADDRDRGHPGADLRPAAARLDARPSGTATTSLAAPRSGVRSGRIVFSHVLPNSLSPVIVQATLSLATAIIEAAALSFLGLGDPDLARPEWGAMLARRAELPVVRPELAFYPARIIIVALGFTLLGESLREALDPKFRR